MEKSKFKEVMQTKREIKEAHRTYNKENGTDYSMVEFLNKVLNYPKEEAKKIRNFLHWNLVF